MSEKTDLRVIKTKKALVESMMECLEKKPFEDLTVQYICDKAMVRRATFYTHFADKFELLGYTVRCQYQSFPSLQQINALSTPKEMYHQMVEDAVHFLAEHIVLFQSLASSQMTHMILNIVRTELEKDLLPNIEKRMQHHDLNELSPQLVFHFYLHGIFGSFMWWVREDYPISKEELVTQIQRMFKIP